MHQFSAKSFRQFTFSLASGIVLLLTAGLFAASAAVAGPTNAPYKLDVAQFAINGPDSSPIDARFGPGDVPGAPHNLYTYWYYQLYSGWNEVSIHWPDGAPSDGPEITHYEVQIDDGPWAPTDSDLIFYCGLLEDYGLIPGDEIQIRVRAVNANGPGEPAENSLVLAVDPLAPELTAAAGNESVTLTWDEPWTGGSPITSYSLSHFTSYYSGGAPFFSGNVKVTPEGPGLPTSHTIDGLESGEMYRFEIRAITEAGLSGRGEVEAVAGPASKPEAPKNVHIFPGNRSLKVNWAAPAKAGAPITAFDVRYIDWQNNDRSVDSNWRAVRNAWTSARGGETSLTINNLTNGTEYEIQVRARNSEGESPWSSNPEDNFYTTYPDPHRSTPQANAPALFDRGKPAITGTVAVGRTAIADITGINHPADDPWFSGYDYRWVRSGVDIIGATKASYILTEADRGHTIAVRVRFSGHNGFRRSLISDRTTAVAQRGNAPPTCSGIRSTSNPISNWPATGDPEITGTAQVEEMLTAVTTDISDPDGLTNRTFTYKWYRTLVSVDTLISGATGSTYTLTQADLGHTLKVEVSFIDDHNFRESRTSDPTDPVIQRDDRPATGDPEITGTAQVEEMLTAVTTDISDPDGLTNRTFTYKWYRTLVSVDTLISGATGSTYTLTQADLGHTLKVEVSFIDDHNFRESRTSDPTDPVIQRDDRPATGDPEITGTAQVEEMLTAVTTDISDPDGLTNRTFTYKWYRGADSLIFGAVNSTYILTQDDLDHTIKVEVSFTDDIGYVQILTSAQTEVVVQRANRTATGTPEITGVEKVGHTLTVPTFDFEDADGITNFDPSFSWFRTLSGTTTQISLASGPSYTLTQAELNHTINVEVGFIDDLGYSESLPSAETGAIAAADPANNPATGKPAIAGTATLGNVLTASPGDIADDDGLTNAIYAYQWFRTLNNIDEAIVNPNGTTYTLKLADLNHTIKVTVTFSDDAGNGESLPSDSTGVVDRPANRLATGQPELSGSPQVTRSLTVSTTGITDLDGLENADFTYQWIRTPSGGADETIANVSGTGYTLTSGDLSHTIKVTVRFTDDFGNPESVTSEPTATVTAFTPRPSGNSGGSSSSNRRNRPATGKPIIEGDTQVGAILTASTDDIADRDGLTNPTYTYRWIRTAGDADTTIKSASGDSYTLVDDDVDYAIKVEVRFRDNRRNSETLISVPTDVVTNFGRRAPEVPASIVDSSTFTPASLLDMTVTANRYVEGPGNDNLKHNIPNLTIRWRDGISRTANFLSYHDATGGLERWGYPISEVTVFEDGALTMFFQRGAVDFHDVGFGWIMERRLTWEYVGGVYSSSGDQGTEPHVLNPNPGEYSGPWGHKISNYSIEGVVIGFADFYNRLGGLAAFGYPLSDARRNYALPGHLQAPNTTQGFIRQYYQAAILEYHQGHIDFVKLTLLGDILRDILVPDHAQHAPFNASAELTVGSKFTPYFFNRAVG